MNTDKQELISVIVPVYKVEEYLDKCLQSIVDQTYQNIEILVVDDGSPDKCPWICDEWAKKDSRIKIIHQENKGVSAARNAALRQINGDYIIFVDSDDWIAPNMLEKLVETLVKNSADAAFCGYNEISEDTGTLYRKYCPSNTGVVSRDEGVGEIFGEYSTMLWNKLFRSSLMKEKSVFFEESLKIGEDELWMIQILKKAEKIVLFNDPLYNYLRRDTGASKDYTLSPARMSEIDSQKMVIDEIKHYGSDKLMLLAQCRMYFSVQLIMKMAFYQGDYPLFSKIDKEIDEVRAVWFAHHSNKLGKFRRRLVEQMMRLKFPKFFVRLLDK